MHSQARTKAATQPVMAGKEHALEPLRKDIHGHSSSRLAPRATTQPARLSQPGMWINSPGDVTRAGLGKFSGWPRTNAVLQLQTFTRRHGRMRGIGSGCEVHSAREDKPKLALDLSRPTAFVLALHAADADTAGGKLRQTGMTN